MTMSYLAKGFTGVALAAMIAVGGVLAVAAPASASAVATGTWVRLSVYNSGLVAALPAPYTINNEQVVTATYDVNAYPGQWMLSEVATDTYSFENRWSHQCLDTENGSSATAGTPVVQEPCDSTSSQKWVLTHDAELAVWHIKNLWSGLSLGIENGSSSAGAGFIQANDGPNNTSRMFQIW